MGRIIEFIVFSRRLKRKNNADSLVPIEQWAAIQKIVSPLRGSPIHTLSRPPVSPGVINVSTLQVWLSNQNIQWMIIISSMPFLSQFKL